MTNSKPVLTPINPGMTLTSEMGSKGQKEEEEMWNTPYLTAIGSLMYLTTTTWPDITYAIGLLS